MNENEHDSPIVARAVISPELEQRFKDHPELLERFRIELADKIWRKALAEAEEEFLNGKHGSTGR